MCRRTHIITYRPWLVNDVLLLLVTRCEAFAGRSTSAVAVVLLVADDVGPSTNDDDPALALEIVDDLPLTLAETAGPTADDFAAVLS